MQSWATVAGILERSALLAGGVALTLVAPPEALAAGEIFEPVGSAGYQIPVRTIPTGDVEVSIPIDLTDPTVAPDQLTVVRAVSPSGDDATPAFSFDYDPGPRHALRAHVSPQAAHRAGNYLVSLRALSDTGLQQTIELTFVRAAPVIDVAPIVFNCVDGGGDCELSRQRIALTESSSLAAASNIRFVFKAPLRNSDVGAVAPVEISPIAKVDAGGQAFAEIRGGEALPLGVTSGVVSIRSDEGFEVSVPVEIRRRRSKTWLFLLLVGGLLLSTLRRGLVARTIARKAAADRAQAVIERLESRLVAYRDESLRSSVRQALREAREELGPASTPDQLSEISERTAKKVEKLIGDDEAARASLAQEARRLIDALAPAVEVPKTLVAPVEALRARLITHLELLEGLPLVGAKAEAQAIRRDLVSTAEAASQWVASMAQLKLGGWQLPSLKQFNDTVAPKIEQFDPVAPPETVIAGAAAIARLVRFWVLSALPRQIDHVVATARDELARLSPNAAVRSQLLKTDQALADLRSMLDGDADDAPAVAIASRALHAALVGTIRAAAAPAASDAVNAALEESDFTRALELLSAARAASPNMRSSVVVESAPEAAPAKRLGMATPALPRSTATRAGTALPVAAAPASPSVVRGILAPFRDGRWAIYTEHLLASVGLAGIAFLSLEPAFVGTPRDFLVTVLCSLGVDLGATSIATTLRGATQSLSGSRG